jgi:predicted PurR-regulated permease PerM
MTENSKNSNQQRGARVLLIAACVVVVVAGLKAASTLILPFIAAVFLAILSLPIMAWLQRLRLPSAIAVPITVVIVLAALGAALYLISGSVDRFVEKAPQYRTQLGELRNEVLAWFEERGVDTSTWASDRRLDPGVVMDFVSSAISSTTSIVSSFILVLLALVFILFEAAQFPAKLQLAFGSEPAMSGRLDTIMQEVQSYFAIKTVISLVTGILVGAWVGICGVEFFLLWGFVAFLLNYIPNLGSLMAAVPTVLIALAEEGLGTAIAVASGYAVINIFMGSTVEPRVMGRRLGLSTLVVLLSLVFWGWVWGPIGMVLSIPLTMFTKILLENSGDLRWIAVFLSAGASGEAKPPGTPS